jgi:poly(3-hydroxybutyrate) depolymerase
MISAKATRDRWLQINGLTGVNPTQTVLDGNQSDAGPANRFDYAGTTPMQWWRLDGAGHTVASQSVPVASNPVTGIQSRDVEFAEVAWSFFKSRLLPGVADVRSTGLDKPETLPTDGRRPR